MDQFTIKRVQINGIPAAYFIPNRAKKGPCCILYHGLNNDYREMMNLAYRLVEKGFHILCPDAPLHGERKGEKLLGYPAPDVFCHMYRLIHTSVHKEFPLLLKWFAKQKGADVSRLGVSGISMGGLTSFALAAFHPGLVGACVSIIGLPDFEEDLRRILSHYQRHPERLPAHSEEYYNWLQESYQVCCNLNPAPKLKNYAPRPLMMIQGKRDQSVDRDISKRLYHHLRLDYHHHDDCLTYFEQDVEHRVTREMEIHAVDFLNRFLS